MFYRIAVLDDDTADLQRTEEMLSDYGAAHQTYEMETACFTETKSFMESVCRTNDDGQWAYDIVVMDICLPEGSGMACAGTLRQKGYEGIIIIVSSTAEHAIDAFQVYAKQYLLKPVSKERFFAAMDRSVKTLERRSGFFMDTLFAKGSGRRDG